MRMNCSWISPCLPFCAFPVYVCFLSLWRSLIMTTLVMQCFYWLSLGYSCIICAALS
ncbi:hypothetical protein V8C26DRAFT_393222 [Trichoderma gracile]